jgi:hypothetical protein
MNEDEFLKQMETLNIPEVKPGFHLQPVKVAIMNAQRSAALGAWLIAVPCYFLLCVFMYYLFHPHMSWFGAMFSLLSGLDKMPYADYTVPLLMVVLPIVCIIINGLAIIHVQTTPIDKDTIKAREVVITIKVKFWNIMLILLSLVIICTFIGYAMTQNISIKN